MRPLDILASQVDAAVPAVSTYAWTNRIPKRGLAVHVSLPQSKKWPGRACFVTDSTGWA